MKQTRSLKNIILQATLVALSFSFLACDNLKLNSQYRDVDPGIEGDQVIELLQSVEAQSGFSNDSQSVSEFFTMLKDVESPTVIYFSESGGNFGPVQSVMSLVNLSFLGSERTVFDVEEVYVFFLDQMTLNGRRNALLLDYKFFDEDQRHTQAFISDSEPEFVDGEFVTILNDGSGTPSLVLRSFDTVDLDLAEVVQLKVGLFSEDGVEDPIGKFSTLFGFESF